MQRLRSSVFIFIISRNRNSVKIVLDFTGVSRLLGNAVTLCKHEHAESDTGTVTAPTRTEKGYTAYTCTKCGKPWDSFPL